MPDTSDLHRLGSWSADDGDAIADLSYAVVDYFDTPIRIVTDPMSIEHTMEEFLDLAATMEVEDMRAIGAVRSFLRALIHPQDFPTFWRLVKEHRQDMVKQMAFAKWLVEEMTGTPFVEGSVSSPGPSPQDPKSEADVSLRVQRRLEKAGRPDLAVAVLSARETRKARTA